MGSKVALLTKALRHELGVPGNVALPPWFTEAAQGLVAREADFLKAEDPLAGMLLNSFASDALVDLNDAPDLPVVNTGFFDVPDNMNSVKTTETVHQTDPDGTVIRTTRECKDNQCT